MLVICVNGLPFRLTNHKIGTVAVKTPVYCPTKQAATSSLPVEHRQRPSASQPVHPSSDSENYSFEDAQVGRPSKTPKTAPEYDSSDSERESFLPESLFNHQERQREHNHPTNMAPLTRNSKGGKKGTPQPKKKAAPSKRKAKEQSDSEEEPSDPEVEVPETDEKDTKIQELEKKLALAQERVKRTEAKGSRGGRGRKGKSVSSALENLVYDLAKTDLFKTVKFISSEEELEFATRLVMNMIAPQEHEDLTGKKLAEAEAKWITENCESVRKAINEWRNYVQGELQKYVKEALRDEDPNVFDQLPKAEEMYDLIMRKGLGKKDPNREYNEWKFDVIWDILMSKVAGHANWSKGKRHHGLMSFHKPKGAGEKDPAYVSEEDEAFLVLLWENYLDRWVYLHKKELQDAEAEEKEAEGEEAQKGSKGAKNQDGKDTKKGDEPQESDEEDEDDEEAKKGDKEGDPKDPEAGSSDDDEEAVQDKPPKEQLVEVKCPYTKPNGGAQRFGGWTNAGRKRFNDLVVLIEKNRKDRKKYLTHVEQAALDRIRALHNCDEREAKRKKKKSKVDDEDDKIDCGVPSWMRK